MGFSNFNNWKSFFSESNFEKLFLLVLLSVSIALRIQPIAVQHPFWIDEFSSGVQAQLYLSSFTNSETTVVLEGNNYLTHSLIALSFFVFGVSETSARLPFILIGSFVPIAAYYLVREVTNKKHYSIAASLFVAFSYIEIAWSTQARGYVLQQLLGVIAFLIAFKLFSRKKLSIWLLSALLIVCLLGFTVHNIFILFAINLGITSLVFYRDVVKKIVTNPFFLVAFLTFAVVQHIHGAFYKVFSNDMFNFFNNVWYYHAFLWQNYSLVIFLAVIGFIYLLKKQYKEAISVASFVVIHLGFFSLLFAHYISKYTLPAFVYLLILAGIGTAYIAESISPTMAILSKKASVIFATMILCLFIIGNGDKFVATPQNYYSVNHDMREIAVIDYDTVYSEIQQTIGSEACSPAVIDTWPDRTRWYLGTEFPDMYYFRWTSEGIRKNTTFFVDDAGQKIVSKTGVKLVSDISDVRKIIENYECGYLFIDDSSLPEEVLTFAEANLKKELTIDSYSWELLENPYSTWPATLYSWGL